MNSVLNCRLRRIGEEIIMGEERIEIIQHDDGLLEIETHGVKGTDCDVLLEELKTHFPELDFTNVIFTREHKEPSKRKKQKGQSKKVRRGHK